MKSARSALPHLTIEATTPEALEKLEAIVIKPDVMRGCFGEALSPRHARQALWRDWEACRSSPEDVHLAVSCLRHGRCEVAGAGYLIDGELRFFVTPEVRRRGLGRALVKALCDEAQRTGRRELEAWVYPENAASAALLEASGFTRCETALVPEGSLAGRLRLRYRRLLGADIVWVFGDGADPPRRAAGR